MGNAFQFAGFFISVYNLIWKKHVVYKYFFCGIPLGMLGPFGIASNQLNVIPLRFKANFIHQQSHPLPCRKVGSYIFIGHFCLFYIERI